MARRPRKHIGDATVVDFYDYGVPKPIAPRQRARRAPKRQLIAICELPDPLPVTEAELDVIETHFADFLDELFGPRL
jgi:hypothetical protein